MRRCRHICIAFPADDLATLVRLVIRLFLAVYLVLFVSLSGLVYTERWAEGAHVTLEMWAEHTQLVQLGYVDHHYELDDSSDHAVHEQDSADSKRLLPFVPVWNALPPFPLALEWTSYVDGFSTILLAALIIVRLLSLGTIGSYKEYLPLTPHRPPIVVS